MPVSRSTLRTGSRVMGDSVLRDRLATAVRKEKAPMFIFQADGDYNLRQSRRSGCFFTKKPTRQSGSRKLYRGSACSNNDAHAVFAMNCDGSLSGIKTYLASSTSG